MTLSPRILAALKKVDLAHAELFAALEDEARQNARRNWREYPDPSPPGPTRAHRPLTSRLTDRDPTQYHAGRVSCPSLRRLGSPASIKEHVDDLVTAPHSMRLDQVFVAKIGHRRRPARANRGARPRRIACCSAD